MTAGDNGWRAFQQCDVGKPISDNRQIRFGVSGNKPVEIKQ